MLAVRRLLLSALCSLLYQRQRQRRDHRRVLAILPGQIITLSDVEAALDLGLVEAPAGDGRIAAGLSAVIDRVLMLNEVRRVAPAEPSPAAIDARVARIRQRIGSPAELSRLLGARGLDETVLAALRRRRSAACVVSRGAILCRRTADRRRNPTSRRISAPAPDRRSPPHADRRMDGGAAAPCGRDGSCRSEPGLSLPRVIVRKHRFRKQNRRHGKTRRRRLLFSAMALGPSLVLAEVAGSRVLSTVAVAPPPLFASPALPAADASP